MLFNSFTFAIFLPCVFLSYWLFFNKTKFGRNLFILVASYFFYGWWDYRFTLLIGISTIVDFLVGKRLQETSTASVRHLYLALSLIINIGTLIIFKYLNFFIDSWIKLWASFGLDMDIALLRIILPVGISFYTFQTLSYTIDVYRKKINPCHDFIQFAAFVAFFPQLVAGPIERAKSLLPQFSDIKPFNYPLIIEGLQQMLWGLFKKVVIADTCGVYVDDIFSNYQSLDAPILFLGAIYFSFQIYCDFSGYSDIAIGTAKLFGFQLMTNFRYPYFARDIAEFWRRWHISLSTWFRDYLYIPLGGSRVSKLRALLNIFIVFVVSGLWHGANLTFIIWGGIHALLFVPLFLLNMNRRNLNVVANDSFLPNLRETLQILVTFVFISIAWVFFRADSLEMAISYLSKMLRPSLIGLPSSYRGAILIIIPLLMFEWINRRQDVISFTKYRLFNYIIYTILILGILLNIKSKSSEFIYFQF